MTGQAMPPYHRRIGRLQGSIKAGVPYRQLTPAGLVSVNDEAGRRACSRARGGAARAWMGNAMMNTGHHCWSVGGILAAVFGAALLAGLVAFLAVRRPWRPGPPSTPAAA